MAIGFDGSTPRKARKKRAKETQENGAVHLVQTDQLNQYAYNHSKKRITVIPLYCDCGRSILVRPKDVQSAPVICSLCNSSFSWQQLTLALD